MKIGCENKGGDGRGGGGRENISSIYVRWSLISMR